MGGEEEEEHPAPPLGLAPYTDQSLACSWAGGELSTEVCQVRGDEGWGAVRYEVRGEEG